MDPDGRIHHGPHTRGARARRYGGSAGEPDLTIRMDPDGRILAHACSGLCCADPDSESGRIRIGESGWIRMGEFSARIFRFGLYADPDSGSGSENTELIP